MSLMGGDRGMDRLLGRTVGEERAWLECFRSLAQAGRRAVAPLAGTPEGRRPLGRGRGGDETMLVDQAAEDAIIAALGSQAPTPYCLLSEEAGEVGEPDAPWSIILDPVDGSLNAKRGLDPYSVAFAASQTDSLAAVSVGYTLDYVTGHEYAAVRGAGFASTRPPGRPEAAGVELVLLESGRPRGQRFRYAELSSLGADDHDIRVRQIGSLALALGYVALGIADVLLAPVPSRAVDVAGGLLMVRESGGGAAALDGLDLWAQPLDLRRRSGFVAWRAGSDPDRLVPRARLLSG